ncbi:SCO family protein [Effusibacillus pohliae]|uniref:SCO family protein n=1 Tax=Effusibacillus pohliae TaxID=232270 RepID=UPI000378E231|nr:SCO family protein [Effusibacillus pohliae]
MYRFLQKNWFRMVATILLFALLGGIGYWFWWGASRFPVVGRAPDFTLNDIQDKPVQFHQLDGKIRLVNFFYASCPDICPMTTSYMAKIQENLKKQGLFGRDVTFVSISFDERDTPNVLARYAKAYRADPNGWIFLRGTNAATHEVARNFGISSDLDPSSNLYVHNNKVILIDRERNIRREYNIGLDTNAKDIVKKITTDIERLARQ